MAKASRRTRRPSATAAVHACARIADRKRKEPKIGYMHWIASCAAKKGKLKKTWLTGQDAKWYFKVITASKQAANAMWRARGQKSFGRRIDGRGDRVYRRNMMRGGR